MSNKPKKIPLKQGDLLISEPFMEDANFKQVAILLADYHKTGSVGFILNKPINMKVNDILASFPDIDSEVYFGGPVGTNTIHYLHNAGDLLEDSNQVVEGVFWGGNYEKLKFLVSSGQINASQIRFFVGYSGWSPGQLEEEIKSGSWIISEINATSIFNTASQGMWKQVMMEKGEVFSILSEMPESFNLN